MSSWFTKYRPSKLSQLHLLSVRSALERLAQGQTFPHALLFAGPKGTGKTSSARILAAMLNDPANAEATQHLFFGGPAPKKLGLKEPNLEDELVARIRLGRSLVVTELDAASNRGIDDVRALKERLDLPPQEGKVAVYILDEAHMLTNEAFNALLKVLEEPPAHVVFILATTERHKIPDTIASRCATVAFQLATEAEIISALEPIVAAEKLELESEEVLAEVAAAAAGSFRDAVKLLEQTAESGRTISLDVVRQVLRRSFTQQLPDLVQAVIDKDPQQVVQLLEAIRQDQPSDIVVLRGLIDHLHQQLVLGLGVSETSEAALPIKISHFLLKELQTVDPAQSHLPLLSVELKLLDIVFRAQGGGGRTGQGSKASTNSGSKNVSTVVRLASTQVTQTDVSPVVIESPIPDQVGIPESMVSAPGEGRVIIEKWPEFLALVSNVNAGIQALLRSAKPLDGELGKATIAVFYSFHQEQLKQPRYIQILETCAQTLTGGKISFEVTLIEAVQSKAEANINLAGVVSPGLPIETLESEDELLNLAKSTLV